MASLRSREIADHVHLCYEHVARVFRRETGQTLTEYRDQVRLTEAKELLCRSSDRVTVLRDGRYVDTSPIGTLSHDLPRANARFVPQGHG